jgi:hypothetical protein
MERRIAQVAELLLNRVPRRGIQQHAARQGWGDNVRCVDEIIARATERIRELARRDVGLELGKARGALDMLFAKALAQGDLRTARLVQRDITELLGLAKPQQVELSGPYGLPPEEIDALTKKFQRLIDEQVQRGKAAPDSRVNPTPPEQGSSK